LRLPLCVIRTSGDRVDCIGETRNISSAGVLFSSSEPLSAGPIEYTVTFPSEPGQAVAIHCFGNVVRAEPSPEGSAFDIAATLQRFEFQRDKMGE
jgi:hypothetical protein